MIKLIFWLKGFHFVLLLITFCDYLWSNRKLEEEDAVTNSTGEPRICLNITKIFVLRNSSLMKTQKDDLNTRIPK